MCIKKRLSHKRFGFVLLELLIVIGIMTLIFPVGFSSVTLQLQRARDLRRKSDLQNIKIAMEQYYSTVDAFPSEAPSCGKPFVYKSEMFMSEFPCDPLTRLPYLYLTDSLSNYQWYKVYTYLERNDDIIIKQIGCQDGCGPECAYNYGVTSSNISITACIWAAPNPTLTPVPTLILTVTPEVSPTPDQTISPTIYGEPTIVPSSTITPVNAPTPSFAQDNFVCAPGGGEEGSCEVFDDPDRSLCPFVYINDSTCQFICADKASKCKNSSGKYKPY